MPKKKGGKKKIPAEVKEAFAIFDADGSGGISNDEVGKVLADHFKIYPSKKELTASFAQFDLNSDGIIKMAEFAKVLAHLKTQELTGKPAKGMSKMAEAALHIDELRSTSMFSRACAEKFAKAVFLVADADHGGTLTKNEIKRYFKTHPKDKAHILGADFQWGPFFKEMDTDGDGQFDIEEFSRQVGHVYHEANFTGTNEEEAVEETMGEINYNDTKYSIEAMNANLVAAARPVVTVISADGDGATVEMPAIFLAPIRQDVVRQVHTSMAKNHRQAYSVSWMAGMQTPGRSWGTGRAVARIPRVPGGGTSRSGQAAFGNMCRGGRMFAPNRVWRKWHFKINKNQRRYALASAMAASALPSLVMARGHRIDEVAEVPLVVADADIAGIEKTKAAVEFLASINAGDDVDKVKDSKKVRRGKGKMRNRRYVMRRGPLLVHTEDQADLVTAFRNIPGIDTADVSRLNLLDLAPGGHVGRFCIWTEAAFAELDTLYGGYNEASGTYKQSRAKAYQLPRPMMTNADITRIINSDEVQSKLSDPKSGQAKNPRKRNPLKNFDEMVKLNPYASVVKRAEILAHQKKDYGNKKRKLNKKTARANKKQFLAFMNSEDAEEEEEEEVEEEGEEAGEDEAEAGGDAEEAGGDEYGDDY